MVVLDERSSLKRRLEEEGFDLKECLGQNLLLDSSLAYRIVEMSAIKNNHTVIEIGPGLGALTGLLSQRAGHLYVIEKDKRFIPFLKKEYSSKENITYYGEDALRVDFSSFPKGSIMVGNLPYNISTPFLRRILPLRDHLSSMTFMLQKEVAQRMVASPGRKEYGVLTLVVQYYARACIKEVVSPSAFYPKPGVDSALLRFFPFKDPPVQVKDEDTFFRVIKASFQQRRKMLVNSLSNNLGLEKGLIKEIIQGMNLDPKLRGESLSLAQFAELSNYLFKEVFYYKERR